MKTFRKTKNCSFIFTVWQALRRCLPLADGKEKVLELEARSTILTVNNTPPASRKTSAPRGVTCVWATEK
jgi:hypothetical protein